MLFIFVPKMWLIYSSDPNSSSATRGIVALRFRSQSDQNKSDLNDVGESNLENRRISIKNDVGSSQDTSGPISKLMPSIIGHHDSHAVVVESEISFEPKYRARISRELTDGSNLNRPSRMESEGG